MAKTGSKVEKKMKYLGITLTDMKLYVTPK